jgi:hypothetical protein
VVVVGSGRAVAKATRNATNRQRWTWLAPRVQSYMEDASDLDDADDDADDKR